MNEPKEVANEPREHFCPNCNVRLYETLERSKIIECLGCEQTFYLAERFGKPITLPVLVRINGELVPVKSLLAIDPTLEYGGGVICVTKSIYNPEVKKKNEVKFREFL